MAWDIAMTLLVILMTNGHFTSFYVDTIVLWSR